MYVFNAIYRSFYRDCSWIASVHCLERSSHLCTALNELPFCAGRLVADYEAMLQRAQGLLSADQDALETGCDTGTTALRLAPFTRRLMASGCSS